MKSGKNNFARVIDYLRTQGLIRNQKDLADKIGSTPTTICRNKHGNVGRTDDETITKFNAVFGRIINIAYLRGESTTMLVADLTPQEKINIGVNSATQIASVCFKEGIGHPATTDLINAALAAKDEAIMALKREISGKDATISLLREQLAERSTLMQSIQKQSTDLANKYETLLHEYSKLLHRINVKIETINGSSLSIATEPPATSYEKKGNK